jgi:hypothetical protein
MMSQDFVNGFLYFSALSLLYWVLARDVVLHQCVMRCCVLPAISYFLRWLIRVFSLSRFFPVAIISFADERHTGIPLKLLFSNLLVSLRRDLLLP